MKIISGRFVRAAFLTLVLVQFLLFSQFCCRHEHSFTRETGLSRKLLSSSSMSSVSTSVGKFSGSKKQNKRASDQSLRKAPASVPNPTQNK